jgi:hypothetical protein
MVLASVLLQGCGAWPSYTGDPRFLAALEEEDDDDDGPILRDPFPSSSGHKHKRRRASLMDASFDDPFFDDDTFGSDPDGFDSMNHDPFASSSHRRTKRRRSSFMDSSFDDPFFDDNTFGSDLDGCGVMSYDPFAASSRRRKNQRHPGNPSSTKNISSYAKNTWEKKRGGCIRPEKRLLDQPRGLTHGESCRLKQLAQPTSPCQKPSFLDPPDEHTFETCLGSPGMVVACKRKWGTP